VATFQGNKPYPSPVIPHVKLTAHFLEVVRDRGISAADLLRFAEAVVSGRLQRTCEKLHRLERGAVGMGDGYVIFARDDEDDELMAVLTYLDSRHCESLGVRSDTRIVSLAAD